MVSDSAALQAGLAIKLISMAKTAFVLGVPYPLVVLFHYVLFHLVCYWFGVLVL